MSSLSEELQNGARPCPVFSIRVENLTLNFTCDMSNARKSGSQWVYPMGFWGKKKPPKADLDGSGGFFEDLVRIYSS